MSRWAWFKSRRLKVTLGPRAIYSVRLRGSRRIAPPFGSLAVKAGFMLQPLNMKKLADSQIPPPTRRWSGWLPVRVSNITTWRRGRRWSEAFCNPCLTHAGLALPSRSGGVRRKEDCEGLRFAPNSEPSRFSFQANRLRRKSSAQSRAHDFAPNSVPGRYSCGGQSRSRRGGGASIAHSAWFNRPAAGGNTRTIWPVGGSPNCTETCT